MIRTVFLSFSIFVMGFTFMGNAMTNHGGFSNISVTKSESQLNKTADSKKFSWLDSIVVSEDNLANVDYLVSNALIYAIIEEDFETVKSLIEDGVNVNVTDMYGFSALMHAIQTNNDDIISVILHETDNVNIQSEAGFTALILAAQSGNLPVAQLLIDKGALVDPTDRKGISALMYAVAYGHFFVTDLLIFYNAQVNHSSADGSTALHLAAWYGQNEIAGLLIASGAEIDAQDKDGNTPLMVAVLGEDLEVVWYLVESGASLEVTNNKGYSPLSLAAGLDNVDMVKFLTDYIFEEPRSTPKKRSALAMAFSRKNREMQNLLLDFEGIKPMSGLYISEYLLDFGLNFNKNELMYGISLGLYESRYRIMTRMIFNKRFSPRAVDMLQEEGLIYRYLEDRTIWSFTTQKDFPLIRGKRNVLGGLVGASVMYSYGNYTGTAHKPDNKFFISPAVDLYYKTGVYYLYGSYTFFRTGVSEIPANRYTIGLRFIFPVQRQHDIRYSPVIE